MAADLDK